jgi:cell division protein FtsW
MARTLKFDRALFIATLLLVCASVVMVYSASAVQAMAKYDEPSYFLLKQVIWAVMGLGLMLVAMHVDYHEYRRPWLIWGLVGATTVMLLAVFLFPEINGARRWLNIQHISVQPSELAKLAAILFAAALLDGRMHRVNDVGSTLLPIGLVTFLLAGLVVYEPDLGTASIIVLDVLAVVFVAGLSYRYLLGTGLVLVPTVMAFILGSSFRRQRIMTFLNPWSDPLNTGFQTIQSLLALGSGGVFGKGLMAGIQKLYYIPEPHTDFIYAVIGEELGLVGTTLTLVCFAVIAWRGLRTSLVAPDRFGTLLAMGITMMVALQAFFNISVVTTLVPTKGIPLPFVSNGGSSLVINLVAMGILLNISRQASPVAAKDTGWAAAAQEA